MDLGVILFRVWFWVSRFRVLVIGLRIFTILGFTFRDFGFRVRFGGYGFGF